MSIKAVAFLLFSRLPPIYFIQISTFSLVLSILDISYSCITVFGIPSFSVFCMFCLLVCLTIFLLQLDMYQVKLVNRPSVMWRGGEGFCNPVIRPHSVSEAKSLDCEVHKCFSGFASPALRWDRAARVGWSWVQQCS